MPYYFSRVIDDGFKEAVERTTAALAHKGFGVLTTIDVAATMKGKLGVDFRPYVILGACNPHFAWRALQAEDKIGTMLPCNVVVTELAPGKVEIAGSESAFGDGQCRQPQPRGDRWLCRCCSSGRGRQRLANDPMRETFFKSGLAALAVAGLLTGLALGWAVATRANLGDAGQRVDGNHAARDRGARHIDPARLHDRPRRRRRHRSRVDVRCAFLPAAAGGLGGFSHVFGRGAAGGLRPWPGAAQPARAGGSLATVCAPSARWFAGDTSRRRGWWSVTYCLCAPASLCQSTASCSTLRPVWTRRR
jgi:uncharacterized protein (DUF302 family)